MDPVSGAEAFRPASLVRGVACAGATDIGRVRQRNEDAYWISADGSLLVVADGLGGHPAGDVAASVAVAAVARHAAAGFAGTGPRAGEWLREAAAAAQTAVQHAAEADPRYHGMATTLVLAVLDAAKLTVLHVGDSRAMLWRGGRMRRTTFDHNGVGDLLRAGVLDAEQARNHPERFQIREVVGLSGGFRAEVDEWEVERGDLVLLCTDGVSDALAAPEIAGILGRAGDAASVAVDLVRAASAAGGHDNATAVVRGVT